MNTLKVYLAALLIMLSLLILCINLSKNAPCNTLEKSAPKVSGVDLAISNEGIFTLKLASMKYADCY